MHLYCVVLNYFRTETTLPLPYMRYHGFVFGLRNSFTLLSSLFTFGVLPYPPPSFLYPFYSYNPSCLYVYQIRFPFIILFSLYSALYAVYVQTDTLHIAVFVRILLYKLDKQ
jgi:hypothetical protein